MVGRSASGGSSGSRRAVGSRESVSRGTSRRGLSCLFIHRGSPRRAATVGRRISGWSPLMETRWAPSPQAGTTA